MNFVNNLLFRNEGEKTISLDGKNPLNERNDEGEDRKPTSESEGDKKIKGLWERAYAGIFNVE